MKKFDMPQNILRIVLLVFLSIVLFGCKSSDEKLIDACISKLDKEAKTITISDKGIGMSQEEVEKYIVFLVRNPKNVIF